MFTNLGGFTQGNYESLRRSVALPVVLLCASAITALGVDNQILSVSPNSAEAGTSNLTVSFTLDSDLPPPPPAGIMPTSVTIGSISGTSVTHTNQYIVTAVFDIPAGEADGAKDCTVTFTPGGNTVNFISSGGFTVGTGSPNEGGSSSNGAPAAGYNLFGGINETSTYLMDNDENIIKTWSSSYTPGNSVYLLEDGTLMRTANTGSSVFVSGGQGGRVEQFDWDGNLIWAFDYDTASYRSHHDIEVLPNGNVLMIAWEMKSEAEALAAGRKPSLLNQSELWPDTVIEVAPTGSYGGDIVWEWCSWDHLVQDYDAGKPNYDTVSNRAERIDLNYASNGNADWHHINAIDYNEDLDQIVLSVRNFSEIWVIDHDTTTAEAAGPAGDLLYRWGNPEAYNAGDASDQQLFVQHDAKWIEEGLEGEDNIHLVEKAAWRESGPLTFYPVVKSYRDGNEERNIGASSCFQESGDYAHREKFIQEEITVGAVRLDELCRELGVPAIDLICMDVQGAALQVLEGLGDKLKDTSYIITELEVSPVYEGQSLLPEVAEYLHSHGFREVARDMQFPEYGDFLSVNEKVAKAA